MADDSTVFDLMMERYNEAALPLREREKENADRIHARDVLLQELEVIQAKVRLADRSIDEAIVSGTGNADALRHEKAILTQRVSQVEDEITRRNQEIKDEREDIQAGLKNLALTVFNHTFDEVREKALDAIADCIEELERIWSQMAQFEAATGPCLSTYIRQSLRPRRWGGDIAERNLSRQMNHWFGQSGN